MTRCFFLAAACLIAGLSASGAVEWVRDFTVDGKRVRLASAEPRIVLPKKGVASASYLVTWEK